MMESIQLDRSSVSSGGGVYSSDRRSSSTQDHFQTHGPPGASGGYPANNTNVSTGKKKTDQVVLEFLYKTVEVVLLSRAYFQPTTPRRARFNLDIQELPHVRDLMRPCRDNVNEPVVLVIAMDGVLLERWQISYTTGVQTHSPLDVINQLREVCRRIGILLRSVYCLARILPAFPVGDRLKTQQEDLGHPVVGLQYALASSTDAPLPWDFEPDQPKQRYSFVPIDTPFGTLQLSVLYRMHNDDLLAVIQRMTRLPATSPQEQHAQYADDDHPHASLQMSSTLTRAIIQDYVPTSANTTPTSSPLLQPSVAPSAVTNLTPLTAPPASPMLRSSPMRIVQEVTDHHTTTSHSLQDGRAAAMMPQHHDSHHRRDSDVQPRDDMAVSPPQAIPRRHVSLDMTSATTSSPQYRITSQPVRIPHSANAAAIASNSAASSPMTHHGSGGGIVRAHSTHLNNMNQHPPHSLHHHGSGSSGPSLYARAHSLDAATDFPQRHHHHQHAAVTSATHRPTQPLAAPYGYVHARPIDASPRYNLPIASPAYSSSPLLRHPNSAPLPRPSPRHSPSHTPLSSTNSPHPLMPVATTDVRFSVGSSSQGSASGDGQPRSASTSPEHTSPPPAFLVHGSARIGPAREFTTNGQPQQHHRGSPLFGISQSPPFRGYSGELTPTSPTTATTPSRLLTLKGTSAAELVGLTRSLLPW
ncbi:hypothetical protein, variant [Aphanomyces invadans]|uniref:Autophagy-related protein 13 N-terminal domain-containing protein n=1 Tax=Aphanomyces invadans TaxID=157072 RepID=A0A024UEM1_9STRA|nr:hypothetical protein, variant [Aphanomyces invadans]ETW04724.1 hypothetical protein, variant [Aphanomyces invadans]|eukprot:XP_008866161.1 hypothetical protein, variant [Aphanomyces invadans]